jgi:tannase/feruloyl esterase
MKLRVHHQYGIASVLTVGLALAWRVVFAAPQGPAAASKLITQADCTAERLGTEIPTSSIGEKVSRVTLDPPRWTAPGQNTPGYCSVDGAMAPVDRSATAKPIYFRVVLPASWNRRAAQLGGAGFNGVIPNLTGGPDSPLARGFATYGSDSGHQTGGPGPRGGRGGGSAAPSDWALNDEVMKNLGYMQMKKTHDAAMVIITRMFGERPRFNYFIGTSQGGREALTVAQRYAKDYEGVIANVPIVGLSSLMLAPELIRIQEKPLANWITPAKVNAIRGEFVRQCDKLDGLADGVINNYMACRALFDVKQSPLNRNPWLSKRCPDNVDPNPADTSGNACLTDGQISTLEFVYSRYMFATPLANSVKSFGMWVPNTDPSGSGLIMPMRYRGQQGAAAESPMHTHLGVLGVTGFLMRDLNANPLDYVEGGAFNRRRVEMSASLDATNPDLSSFAKRGKMIVTIGTNDTLASPGAQLDYYQSVIDKMGRPAVDKFARFFVIPQANHGLAGTNYATDGEGKTISTAPIPNTYDRLSVLMEWVENNTAPPMALTVTAASRSLPLCSYPTYPKYVNGPVNAAASYTCSTQ